MARNITTKKIARDFIKDEKIWRGIHNECKRKPNLFSHKHQKRNIERLTGRSTAPSDHLTVFRADL